MRVCGGVLVDVPPLPVRARTRAVLHLQIHVTFTINIMIVMIGMGLSGIAAGVFLVSLGFISAGCSNPPSLHPPFLNAWHTEEMQGSCPSRKQN
jgi:hypothetical protein